MQTFWLADKDIVLHAVEKLNLGSKQHRERPLQVLDLRGNPRISRESFEKLDARGIANLYTDWEPTRMPKKIYTVSQLAAGAIAANAGIMQRLIVTVIQAVGVPEAFGKFQRSDCYVQCETQGIVLVTPSQRGKTVCKVRLFHHALLFLASRCAAHSTLSRPEILGRCTVVQWSDKLFFSVQRKALRTSTLRVSLMRGSATGEHMEVGHAEIASEALVNFLSQPEGTEAEMNLQIVGQDGTLINGCLVYVMLTTLDSPLDAKDDDLDDDLIEEERHREVERIAASKAETAQAAIVPLPGPQERVKSVGCCGCSCGQSTFCVIS